MINNMFSLIGCLLLMVSMYLSGLFGWAVWFTGAVVLIMSNVYMIYRYRFNDLVMKGLIKYNDELIEKIHKNTKI